MAKTELEIQNEIRDRNGLPPLTELPAKPLSDEQKQAAELKAKQDKEVEDAAAAKKIEDDRIAAELAEKEKNKPIVVEAELNDDKVLEYLTKNKGLKVSSLDSLKPSPDEAEKEKAAQQREDDKIQWAIKNGKFNTKQLKAFAADSKDPKQLVFNQAWAEAKKADPELTEAEFKAEFDERFAVEEKPESRQYKRGQAELNAIADNLLKQQYAAFYNLESEYSQHEKQIESEKSKEMRILANAPAYKKDIEEIFGGLKSKAVSFGENDMVNIPIPEEFVLKAKEKLLNPEFAQSRIAAGWKKEELEEIARTMVGIENQDYFIQKGAEAYHKKHQQGTRGLIPPIGGGRRQDESVLTENQAKAAERHGVDPNAISTPAPVVKT